MGKFVVLLSALVLIAASPAAWSLTAGEKIKSFVGVSTKDTDEARPSSVSKILDYEYAACYAKVEAILRKMPRTSVYARTYEKIAVYYVDPNTTPVGIYFTKIDPNRTKVEISSQSVSARDWVAKNVFAEKALPKSADSQFMKSKAEETLSVQTSTSNQ